jgi:hypothetical protein
VAVTLTVPLPAGTSTEQVVVLPQLTEVEAEPPNVNDVAPGTKPVPVIVTVVPAPAGFGLMLVIVTPPEPE